MWTNTSKQFYEIFLNFFFNYFFLWFLSSEHTVAILSSDTINLNNLHYVYLCNDFFTGIIESANY